MATAPDLAGRIESYAIDQAYWQNSVVLVPKGDVGLFAKSTFKKKSKNIVRHSGSVVRQAPDWRGSLQSQINWTAMLGRVMHVARKCAVVLGRRHA